MSLTTTAYGGPLGTMILAVGGDALVGCWFEGQKHFGARLIDESTPSGDSPVLSAACEWLDAYFSGGSPLPDDLPLAPRGTDFQQRVWMILKEIPSGSTTTYGDIARRIAADLGRPRMSSQAVGGAVGRNPLSVIVPCHRVVSSTGAFTGYAGGIGRKKWLLHHEHVRLPGLEDAPLFAGEF